jgi:hypothetical protein
VQSEKRLPLDLLETILFCPHALFPVFLPFFKYIVMFCEDVYHHTLFYLNQLNCFKMAVSSIREQREVTGGQVRHVGGDGT